MAQTEDDIRPLALGGKISWVGAAKKIAKVLLVLAPALGGAVTSYRTAATDTRERVQATKNKSEAGYQVTRQAVEALEQRVLVLEERAHKAEVAVAKAKPPRTAHRGIGLPAPPAPPPPSPLPQRVKQLPSNLDLAERQVYNGVATPSPPRALLDAGAP
jgi:hypothetical protein